MSNSSIWPYQVLPFWARVDLGARKHYSIFPLSSRTGASSSDGLVSYQGHLLWGRGLTPLQRCCQCILRTAPANWDLDFLNSNKIIISLYVCCNFIFLFKMKNFAFNASKNVPYHCSIYKIWAKLKLLKWKQKPKIKDQYDIWSFDLITMLYFICLFNFSNTLYKYFG